MKNVTFSGNALTRLIKPAAATLLFMSLLGQVQANPIDKTKNAPVEVKYLGSVQGKPLFQIAFNNPLGEEVTLSLRDENGVLIYSDVVKDKSYSRKLQFNDLDTDKLRVTLTLRTKKESQSQTFEITKSTRVVEDVAVVSL
jgi:hypothetical protein